MSDRGGDPSNGPGARADDLDALKTRLPPPPPARADDLDAMRTRVESAAPEARPPAGPTPRAGAPLPPDQLPTGFLLDGRLMVIRQLGHGAMGVVYEVIDTRTQARYAAKLLNAALAADSAAVDLMAREVAAAQAVTHQNLLKVNYFADSGPYKYLVMEYLDGADLATLVARRGGKLPVEEGLKILRQVAVGLDHLHSKGLVHQDVKPQNIFVTVGGEVRVLDYGIAKVVRAHGAPGAQASGGTLAYMAPEQLRGEAVDRRADVYAFGLVCVEALTGRLPFDVRDAKAVTAWHVDPGHAIPPLPEGAPTGGVSACLRVDSADRPPTCALFEVSSNGALRPQSPTAANSPLRPLRPTAASSEIEKLERRHAEDPDSRYFAPLADACRKAGQLDRALELIRAGLEKHPDYLSAHIVLGRCLVDKKEDEGAGQAFERVLGLDSKNIVALMSLSEIAERRGEPLQARQWLQRLLQVDPMNARAEADIQRLDGAMRAPSEPK